MKGLSYSDSKKQGLELLNLFNISEKKTELVSNLSGGMKRKLSLAIALIGNPEVSIIHLVKKMKYCINCHMSYCETLNTSYIKLYVKKE